MHTQNQEDTPLSICQIISCYATGEEFSEHIPTWKNVKTDFGTEGDVITDDAPAINTALYTFRDMNQTNSSVLYFPAGTSMPGSTIFNADHDPVGTYYAGLAIVGEDPFNTVFLWDGPEDGTMFKLDGLHLKISRITSTQ